MSSMKPTKGPIIFADVRTKSRRCLFDRSLVLLCSISALLLWFQPLCLSNLLGYRISAANDVQANLVGTVKWWRCTGFHDDFRAECGYIIAPLDYYNSDVGNAYIALSRFPALVQPRKGIILINPGGPGGSGKTMVSTLGGYLQSLLGREYDIIGFDPRGIGESQPKTTCFTGGTNYADFQKNTILARSYEIASNMSRKESRKLLIAQQREADALYKTQFEVCDKTMGDLLRYMGTSTVVRDIDFITTQLEGEDALINYWGGSYGSILGQYLVNMLPNRVGRVVIDGIADAVAWSNKPSHEWYRQWLSSTNDAYDIFLARCSEVGPKLCALAKAQGEDPSNIKSRIENLFDSLYYEPLPVANSLNPGVLTSGRARVYLLAALQRPISWQQAASNIARAMAGDGSGMILQQAPGRDLARSAVSCNDNEPFAPPTHEAIIDETLDVFEDVSRLVFATITTEPDAGCQYWPVTPPERFEGPWNHTLRNPMLVISNTADPVTPISSGKLVQELLGDSARLLVQDSPGHCSLAVPSYCTNSHLRAYFSNGTLPEPGTICPTDFPPFPEPRHLALQDDHAYDLFVQHVVGEALARARKGEPYEHIVEGAKRVQDVFGDDGASKYLQQYLQDSGEKKWL